MKDSLRFLTGLFMLAAALPVLAQKGTKKTSSEATLNPIADARTRTDKPKQYDDSAEFEKAFKELYSLVKPKGTIREIAEKQVDRQLATLIKQGVDSVEVTNVAYAGLDENAAYKIYFETYRQKLTAKELKAYLAFLKTPEGAKVQSVTLELTRALSEVNNYVTKTINTNLTPIRSTLRERIAKAQKEKDEQMKSDTTEAGRMYRMQMHMRDSIMQARGIDLKK